MAGETYLTVVGNLTADPQYRVLGEKNTPNVTFSIAATPRQYDRATGAWQDQETVFFNCVSWANLADNISKSLKKGMRVIARGSIEPNNYENKDGVNVREFRLRVTEIGPSLVFQTADIMKSSSSSDSVMPNSFQNKNQSASNSPAPAPEVNQQSDAGSASNAQTNDNPFANTSSEVNISTPSSGDSNPWTAPANDEKADSKEASNEETLGADDGNPFL
ncbi:MAG: single-stranded DNA-binding protein [Bifidobacteriaceae bacterium]|jgi:single-strand DNA-binding protein|nr:single-stranded DNA-binding protein [Bifidobacteriaceae bacterium]